MNEASADIEKAKLWEVAVKCRKLWPMMRKTKQNEWVNTCCGEQSMTGLERWKCFKRHWTYQSIKLSQELCNKKIVIVYEGDNGTN